MGNEESDSVNVMGYIESLEPGVQVRLCFIFSNGKEVRTIWVGDDPKYSAALMASGYRLTALFDPIMWVQKVCNSSPEKIQSMIHEITVGTDGGNKVIEM